MGFSRHLYTNVVDYYVAANVTTQVELSRDLPIPHNFQPIKNVNLNHCLDHHDPDPNTIQHCTSHIHLHIR